MRIKPLVFGATAISNSSKKTNVNSGAIHVGGLAYRRVVPPLPCPGEGSGEAMV
jgi:hypothetical protein